MIAFSNFEFIFLAFGMDWHLHVEESLNGKQENQSNRRRPKPSFAGPDCITHLQKISTWSIWGSSSSLNRPLPSISDVFLPKYSPNRKRNLNFHPSNLSIDGNKLQASSRRNLPSRLCIHFVFIYQMPMVDGKKIPGTSHDHNILQSWPWTELSWDIPNLSISISHSDLSLLHFQYAWMLSTSPWRISNSLAHVNVDSICVCMCMYIQTKQ